MSRVGGDGDRALLVLLLIRGRWEVLLSGPKSSKGTSKGPPQRNLKLFPVAAKHWKWHRCTCPRKLMKMLLLKKLTVRVDQIFGGWFRIPALWLGLAYNFQRGWSKKHVNVSCGPDVSHVQQNWTGFYRFGIYPIERARERDLAGRESVPRGTWAWGTGPKDLTPPTPFPTTHFQLSREKI